MYILPELYFVNLEAHLFNVQLFIPSWQYFPERTANIEIEYLCLKSSKQVQPNSKKSDGQKTVACVGAIYLSGPSPAKYCRQK